MVRNIPINTSSYLLHVSSTFLLNLDTTIYCANKNIIIDTQFKLFYTSLIKKELPLTVSFLLSTLLAMGVPPCLDYCFKCFEFFSTLGVLPPTKIYHSLYQKIYKKGLQGEKQYAI